jgi:hypothetical protein
MESIAAVESRIRTNSREQNIALSDSLNFRSILYYYHAAMEATGCATGDCQFDGVQPAEYIGKVLNDNESGIRPLLSNGNLGWLLNLDGCFMVGTTLMKYTNDYVFCIGDYTSERLASALETKTSDYDNGIYVHSTLVEERGGCCSHYLQSPIVRDGDFRIQSATSYLANGSYSQFESITKTWVHGVQIYQRIALSHQTKVWYGWKCKRNIWEYDTRLFGTYTGLPFIGVDQTSGAPMNITTGMRLGHSFSLTTGNECSYYYNRMVLSGIVTSKAIIESIGFCINEHELNVKATHVPIYTKAKCVM